MNINYIEIIGYLASAFVIGSFLIKNNLKKTRIISLIGCLVFIAYGILLNAGAIILTNTVLAFVQIYYLSKGF